MSQRILSRMDVVERGRRYFERQERDTIRGIDRAPQKQLTKELADEIAAKSAEELLTDDYFFGRVGGKGIWRPHMDDIIELWERRRSEGVCLFVDQEGIGSGKTTKAAAISALLVLEILTTWNIREKFGIRMKDAPIVGITASRTEKQSREVTFNYILPFCTSQFFTEYFPPNFRKTEVLGVDGQLSYYPKTIRFPGGVFLFPATREVLSTLGFNIYFATIDEANYLQVVERSRQEFGDQSFDAAKFLFDEISSRIKNRFMVAGKVHGLLTMISNSRYVNDFLHRVITMVERGEREAVSYLPPTMVRRRAVWDVLWEVPEKKLSHDYFTFDLENMRVSGHGTFGPDERPDRRGYEVRIPVDYEPEARRDAYNFWRRYGDTPLSAINPAFTDRAALAECIDRGRHSPYVEKAVGDSFRPEIHNLFRPKPGQPLLHLHIDLGQKRDACGFAAVSVPNWTPVGNVMRPFVRVEVLARITAPPGGEVRFADVRGLIYELRERGFPIGMITFDGWQSVDSIQELTDKGFYAGVMSIDRTSRYPTIVDKSIGPGTQGATLGAIAYRPTNGQFDAAMRSLFDAITERRISIPVYLDVEEQTWLEREILALEYNERTATVEKSPHGTDDLVQALAGAVFNAMNLSGEPEAPRREQPRLAMGAYDDPCFAEHSIGAFGVRDDDDWWKR